MPIPDYQALMLPVLTIAAEGETRVPVISDRIADQFGLSEEERNESLPNSKQLRLHNRIHWAKFYMSKAGLIDSPRRGTFVASPAGRALLAQHPARLNVDALKAYPSFVEFIDKPNGAGETSAPIGEPIATQSSITPEEQIDAAREVLNSALRTDLLARLLERQRWIAWLGLAIVVYVAIEMIISGWHEVAAHLPPALWHELQAWLRSARRSAP